MNTHLCWPSLVSLVCFRQWNHTETWGVVEREDRKKVVECVEAPASFALAWFSPSLSWCLSTSPSFFFRFLFFLLYKQTRFSKFFRISSPRPHPPIHTCLALMLLLFTWANDFTAHLLNCKVGHITCLIVSFASVNEAVHRKHCLRTWNKVNAQ